MSYTLSNSKHRARIEHVCVGCLDTIAIGSIYHKWVGLIQCSEFCESKLCEECREFYDSNSDLFNDGEFGEGEIGEARFDAEQEDDLRDAG